MSSIRQFTLGALLFICLGTAGAQTPQINQLKQQALEQEASGDLAGAMATNRQLLQRQPKDVMVMNTIAGLYGVQQQYPQEIEWADKALAINAAYAPAHINRGTALAGLGRLDEARKAFQKAMQVAPDSPLGPYSLGVLAEGQRQDKEALEWYLRSVKIDPAFENGWFNAAAMYANLGHKDEAIAALHKVLALNPQADDAQQMLGVLQRAKAGQ